MLGHVPSSLSVPNASLVAVVKPLLVETVAVVALLHPTSITAIKDNTSAYDGECFIHVNSFHTRGTHSYT